MSFPGTPTVLRHKDITRQVYANVHVETSYLSQPRRRQMVSGNSWLWVDDENRWAPFVGSGSQVITWKKPITMRGDGILIQPNATHVPKLVSMMKVSARRRKGLPYHATLEAYSADALHGEQAASFRSGLGLALYMAMDWPDIQSAVKTLSSYTLTTIKALAALKHLASYLDGTPDHGVLLQATEEG